MAAEPEVDVFLSYAAGDERWASRLNDELTDRGLRVFFDRSRVSGGERWSTVTAQALSTSRVLAVLWSRSAHDSEHVGRELDRFDGATVVVELQPLEDVPRDNVELVRVGDDAAYKRGPEALSPDQWRTISGAILRVVRRVSGQAAQLKLSPSVRALASRLPGDVTGSEIVTDLLSTHTDYARAEGRSYELGKDPANVLRQPVSAWIDEVSSLFDATQQPELHGRQLIIGLALAYPPLGRQLRESGLFQAIEGELRERVDLILSEAGKRAREALEPVPLAGYVADSLLGDDMFDLRSEVAALCAVISAESVHPPLSIGLFGPWGSGKSFFMRLMQQEIRRIAARSAQARAQRRDDPFCSDIVQIEFNAWHYLDANLWASLMARIWEGLAAHGGEIPDPRLQELLSAWRRRTRSWRTPNGTPSTPRSASATPKASSRI